MTKTYFWDTIDWSADLHYFAYRDLHLLLDVNSGTVHMLDRLAWDLLHHLERTGGNITATVREMTGSYSEGAVTEALAELEELQAQGVLFTKVPVTADYNFPEGMTRLKSLCLHVAHDCNMRCRYCFAGTGTFGGGRGLMSPEVGKAALDFLIQASGPLRRLEVDFFGGEPLLNFAVVKELVAYGRQRAAGKQLELSLTTNGLLLDAAAQQFLNETEIRVVLSLDGRPEVNDAMRPLADGQGSYAAVLPRLQAFVASRPDQWCYVRGTYTRHNLDFSNDVQHLAALGFRRLSLEPVVAAPSAVYALREEDLPVLAAEYDRLVEIMLDQEAAGQPLDFFHFNLDLLRGPCLAKRLSGCGAGLAYLAVTPEGELYPCHQFVGQPAYLMGDVFQGITRPELRQRFQEAHIYHKASCRRCWARFYCSGGCHAQAVACNGDLLQPNILNCHMQQKRLECALYLQVRQALKQGNSAASA